MPTKGLTPKRVETATPKGSHFVIRDRKVKGLGLRVSPSGLKTYALEKLIKGVRHKETLGAADNLTLKEARTAANKRIGELAALHNIGPETPFEVMVEITLMRMARLWKPSTMQSKHTYIRIILSLVPQFVPSDSSFGTFLLYGFIFNVGGVVVNVSAALMAGYAAALMRGNRWFDYLPPFLFMVIALFAISNRLGWL